MKYVTIQLRDGRSVRVKHVREIYEGYNKVFLWVDGSGNIRAYVGDEMEGHEIALDKVVPELLSHYERDVYDKVQKYVRDTALEDWNKFKKIVEQEHYACPFCDLPDEPPFNNEYVFKTKDDLLRHIAEKHIKVKVTAEIVKSLGYKNFSEEYKIFREMELQEAEEKKEKR
ncbi:MAG: hypothetical protein ACP5OE_09730 [Thermodesulfobium sp.]